MDWRPVALALAVVLAGCGSFVGAPGPDGSGTERPTLTPVPVPAVPTTAGPTLPPGVTGAGVPNANALFGAHRAELSGRSYTLTVRVWSDGTFSRRTFRVESRDRYLKRDVLGGVGQNVTTYVAGDDVYVRSTFGGNTEYAEGSGTDRLGSQTVRLAGVFLRLENATVAETLVDGRLHYEIRGSYPAHPRVDGLKNFSIRAVVSPAGLVRSMTASYTVHESAGTTNITRSFVYTDVGSTDVDRPDWVVERWGDADGDRNSSRSARRTTSLRSN